MNRYLIDNIINNDLMYMLNEEIRLSLRNDLENYISSQYNKLKLTKSIIFRNTPVDFYDNYVPLTLINPQHHLRVDDPYQLMLKFQKIGIIGSAGSGKTTLLKHIALQTFEREELFPIIIELRNYNSSSLSFEDFVAQQISKVNFELIKKLFKSSNFIFLLDGYDEIDYMKGNNFINQIDSFVTNYSSNYFVISSRPGTNVESLSPFYIFEIAPLNFNDISFYVEKLKIPYDKRNKILKSINSEDEFIDFLTNPLLLSLYIVTYSAIGYEFLPNKSIFLRKVIDYLFTVHDSVSKLGYVREKLSNLNVDSLEKISSILAFRIFFSTKYSLSKDELYKEFDLIKKSTEFYFENDKLLYDLTITVGILIDNGNYYSFPHLSILEYLTANFVSTLNEKNKTNLYNTMNTKNIQLLSVSFFEFLYELDRDYFLKLFLIPAIDKLIENKYDFNENIYKDESFLVKEFLRRNVNTILLNNKLSDEYLEFDYFTLRNIKNEIEERLESKFNNDNNPLFEF
ncbi:NACHT domain-containing protein [Chryseobacterium sp. Bi04]|uniref:NACHT domain-containing protein n=1 Tax=Chryseobacterium sp. Bi04 TaxID=2822345 RepID=UPI001E144E3E|nr:NACHT domain-containing protein [Chryseobacterium sp. Bi04]CAH0242684.1 hypothetical protein SRABI04_03019 [Chryseobacterium sp. Bi04]